MPCHQVIKALGSANDTTIVSLTKRYCKDARGRRTTSIIVVSFRCLEVIHQDTPDVSPASSSASAGKSGGAAAKRLLAGLDSRSGLRGCGVGAPCAIARSGGGVSDSSAVRSIEKSPVSMG